jgi:hypothetical protein
MAAEIQDMPPILSRATMPNGSDEPALADTWYLFLKSLRDVLVEVDAASDRLTMTTSDVDPTVDDIADGQYLIWKNTTGPTRKLWLNDGGTLYSVALT